MKFYKGIAYFQGYSGRWTVRHDLARINGYYSEFEAKQFIDKVAK